MTVDWHVNCTYFIASHVNVTVFNLAPFPIDRCDTDDASLLKNNVLLDDEKVGDFLTTIQRFVK